MLAQGYWQFNPDGTYRGLTYSIAGSRLLAILLIQHLRIIVFADLKLYHIVFVVLAVFLEILLVAERIEN